MCMMYASVKIAQTPKTTQKMEDVEVSGIYKLNLHDDASLNITKMLTSRLKQQPSWGPEKLYFQMSHKLSYLFPNLKLPCQIFYQ